MVAVAVLDAVFLAVDVFFSVLVPVFLEAGVLVLLFVFVVVFFFFVVALEVVTVSSVATFLVADFVRVVVVLEVREELLVLAFFLLLGVFSTFSIFSISVVSVVVSFFHFLFYLGLSSSWCTYLKV